MQKLCDSIEHDQATILLPIRIPAIQINKINLLNDEIKVLDSYLILTNFASIFATEDL